MKAFAVHFAVEFRAGFRDRPRFFMTYLFPLTVFLLMAGLMTGVNPGFRDQMIPAMILFAMMSSILLFLSSLWIAQREAGVYRSYRINGVPARDVLLAPALAALVHLAVVSAIIAALGHFAFGAPLPAHPVAFVAGWLFAALSIEGLAMVIGTAVPDQRAGTLVAQLVFLPSIMLGGLMMPAALIPRDLSLAGRIFPARWAMEAMTVSGAVGGSGDLAFAIWMPALGVLAATAVTGYAIAISIFEWHTSSLRTARSKLLALFVLAPAAIALILLALLAPARGGAA